MGWKTTTVLNHTPGCGIRAGAYEAEDIPARVHRGAGAILELDMTGSSCAVGCRQKRQSIRRRHNDIAVTANGGAYARSSPVQELPTSVRENSYLAPGSPGLGGGTGDLNYATESAFLRIKNPLRQRDVGTAC